MTIRPPIHGRDHRVGGADPIPFQVFLAPSGLMGTVLPGVRVSDISFGLNAGVLYIPSREGDPVETGERIRSSFAFAEPGSSHFDWLASRLHLVTGLTVDTYRPTEPWESDPWNGGSSSALGTAASGTLSPIGGNWQNRFYGFAGVSSDDTDTVHFETPGGAIDADEQYGWDLAGVGHIGYLFHDFTTSEAGDITISFASGVGPTKAIGYIRCLRDGAVTVGAMAGETDDTGTAQSVVTLTDDVPDGSGLIVVTAAQGPSGYDPGDALIRPVIDIESREASSSLVPVYKIAGQTYPVLRDVGGMGAAGGDLDGGSP